MGALTPCAAGSNPLKFPTMCMLDIQGPPVLEPSTEIEPAEQGQPCVY